MMSAHDPAPRSRRFWSDDEQCGSSSWRSNGAIPSGLPTTRELSCGRDGDAPLA